MRGRVGTPHTLRAGTEEERARRERRRAERRRAEPRRTASTPPTEIAERGIRWGRSVPLQSASASRSCCLQLFLVPVFLPME